MVGFYLDRLKFILCYIIYLIEKFLFKYITCKDIIKKFLNIDKYDKIHSLTILYIIFDIEIYTITYLYNRIITIYYNKKKISEIIINNEVNITNTNKPILSLYYLDQYHFINLLEVYNCGIIYHYTTLFTHIYNYLGDRRVEYDQFKPFYSSIYNSGKQKEHNMLHTLK